MSDGRFGGVERYRLVIPGSTGTPDVLAGTVDPTAGGGVVADEGSIYLRFVATAGRLFCKTGAANTAWTDTAGVFGNDQTLDEENARTTTTSNVFQNKFTLATGALTGTYIVFWKAGLDNAGALGEVRLQNDTDAVTLDGPQIFKAGDSGEIQFVGGFASITLAGVTKDLIIQFRDQSGGSTQGVQRARIFLFRRS